MKVCPICGGEVRHARQTYYVSKCLNCNWLGYESLLVTKIEFDKNQRKKKLLKLNIN